MFMSPPEATYREMLTGRVAVLLLVIVVVFMVLVVADFDMKNLGPGSWITIAITGALYAYFWQWSAKRQLTIHPEGVSFSGLHSSKDLRWEEISETRYFQIMNPAYTQLGLIGILMASYSSKGGKQGSLDIYGTDGKKKFTIGTSLKNGEAARRQVLARVNPRLKADLARRLGGGEPIAFGLVILSRQGIGFKNKPEVPFAEAEIKFNGMRLRVKRKGKFLDAFGAPARKIPNVFILLEMADDIQRGGAPRQQDPMQFMNT
jgi:hypothetical protein